MEETLKNRVILILAILTIIFLTGTIRSCATTKKLKSTLLELNSEKAIRWDSEQKMNEIKQEKGALEKTLEEVKAENEVTKNALLQEQLISQSLKGELQKVTKLKEALEEDLKEALIKAKSGKSTK